MQIENFESSFAVGNLIFPSVFKSLDLLESHKLLPSWLLNGGGMVGVGVDDNHPSVSSGCSWVLSSTRGYGYGWGVTCQNISVTYNRLRSPGIWLLFRALLFASRVFHIPASVDNLPFSSQSLPAVLHPPVLRSFSSPTPTQRTQLLQVSRPSYSTQPPPGGINCRPE